MDNFLHLTDKLYVTSGMWSSPNVNATNMFEQIEVLTEAFGIAQHHDAVAGTAKQAVSYDYEMRLSIGEASAQNVINEGMNLIIFNPF